MSEKLNELLDEEIRSELLQLADLNPGSKEKTAAVEDVTKLYRLKLEETKNEMEFGEKYERRRMENEQCDLEALAREKQMKEQVKERYIRVGIAAAELVLPLVFYAAWIRMGLKFEEDGTFTSTTFKGLINRFRPTKR